MNMTDEFMKFYKQMQQEEDERTIKIPSLLYNEIKARTQSFNVIDRCVTWIEDAISDEPEFDSFCKSEKDYGTKLTKLTVLDKELYTKVKRYIDMWYDDPELTVSDFCTNIILGYLGGQYPDDEYC